MLGTEIRFKAQPKAQTNPEWYTCVVDKTTAKTLKTKLRLEVPPRGSKPEFGF
jgi:hypothetical protein